MRETFPKDIQDCMKECILSIFWPKKDIIEFFENNNCSIRELPSKKISDDMSRYEIVEYVFKNLLLRTDKGLGQFRSILQSLINWSYFDPYWFEDMKKLVSAPKQGVV